MLNLAVVQLSFDVFLSVTGFRRNPKRLLKFHGYEYATKGNLLGKHFELLLSN